MQKGKPVRSTKDVRYFLAEFSLLDPHVQQNFDLIIIDAPPRLTTSHIQAMCASTHLLIPTILDGLSSDAVARYLDQVATHKLGLVGDLRTAICPYLRPIGVVCTLLPNNHADLTGRLNVLHARIAAGRLVPNIFPERCFIRQRPPYREHAGERIAYASLSNDHHHMDLRTEVDMLGDEIAPALGCGVWGRQRREVSRLKPAVDVFAEALGAAGAQMSASGFLAIGSFFAEFPEVQVTALVRRGAQLRPTEASSHRSESDISCAVTVALLDALAKILELGGAKAAFVKDLLSFNQLLRGLGELETLSAALDKLRASMRPEPVEQVVDNYIKRLKGEMGTAGILTAHLPSSRHPN